MIGLLSSIIIFNIIAFKTNKLLSRTETANLWAFTIAFQNVFDVLVDVKLRGYWYFSQAVDWGGFLAHTVLLPPVNMLFINWYPFRGTFWQQTRYIVVWVLAILIYETLALLPEPWGYFYYGWWTIWHSAALNPVLFIILIGYYKLFIHEPRLAVVR